MLPFLGVLAFGAMVSAAALLSAVAPHRSARGRGRDVPSETPPTCSPPQAEPPAVPAPDASAGCVQALVLGDRRVVWTGSGRRHVSDWDAQRLELMDVPAWVDPELVDAIERRLASTTQHAGRA